MYQATKLPVNMLHRLVSLKTLCPYCDPCDSFKTIPLHTKIIPTSRNELESIQQVSKHLNRDPYSTRVVLFGRGDQYEDLRNQQALLKYIQLYPIYLTRLYLYASAGQHLTSLLLPKSANITFSAHFGKYYAEWENVIVDTCSPSNATNSHPIFRPMIKRSFSRSSIMFQESRLVTRICQFRFVSCHKEQIHWSYQLLELVSPFDILTWSLIFAICLISSRIVKISLNLHSHAQNPSLFDLSFSTFWALLDQSNILFKTYNKSLKHSFYWCVSLIPLTWLYLSTLYKGENVTRLTADPPLIQFDTFEMLEEYQFTIYSRTVNLNTSNNAEFYNVNELAKLHKQYGRILTHEALPIVSELWYELMNWLRKRDKHLYSLNFLKNEIPRQMWKYINNSAMFPDNSQKEWKGVSAVQNFYI